MVEADYAQHQMGNSRREAYVSCTPIFAHRITFSWWKRWNNSCARSASARSMLCLLGYADSFAWFLRLNGLLSSGKFSPPHASNRIQSGGMTSKMWAAGPRISSLSPATTRLPALIYTTTPRRWQAASQHTLRPRASDHEGIDEPLDASVGPSSAPDLPRPRAQLSQANAAPQQMKEEKNDPVDLFIPVMVIISLLGYGFTAFLAWWEYNSDSFGL
jgi:hypothetical protein